MEYLKVHDSLPEVSRICLGTWAIGGWMWGGNEESLSIKTIHAALDQGINFIDTAPVYGFGVSETVVGKALSQSKNGHEVVVATKAGLEWQNDGKVFRNSDPKRIAAEVEDSLKRLHRDVIDLFQIHWPDDLVEEEKVAEVAARLLEQGKIKAVGVSNYSVEQMERFSKVCPIHTSQPPFNLFERDVEKEVFPYSQKQGITTLAYGALCRGLLSGRMKNDTKFEGDDLRNVDPKFKSPRFGQYLAAVEALDQFAQKNYSKSVMDLAVRWLLDKGKTIALWGARGPHQLDRAGEVMGWKLDKDAMAQIDHMIQKHVTDPVGPEFMHSPLRNHSAYKGEYPV